MAYRIPTISDYQVPFNENIEATLIADLISAPQHITEIRKQVKPAMFFSQECKKLYTALLAKVDNSEHIDLTTMFPIADRKFFTDNILSLLTGAGDGFNTIDHANSVFELFVQREAYFSAVKMLEKVAKGANALDIIDENSKFGSKISGEMHDNNTESSVDICNEVANELASGKEQRVPTGIRGLDFYTYGGFGAGDLVILAARPSVGKTTLAMQFAQFASLRGMDTVIFSLEMTKADLMKRQLIATGEVTPYEIYSKQVNWEAYERAVAKCANPHLFINDECNSIDDIISKITILVQEGKCKIAFIDYLGLIASANSRVSLTQQITDITRRLKLTAKSCGIPIVLLSQLSRASASEKRSPQLHDLRDSGSIEQDADKVIMMERPDTIEEGNFIDMWLRKNRGGKAGEICLRLKGDDTYSNFYEV